MGKHSKTQAQCPECSSTIHKIVATHIFDDGTRLRRKHCQDCGARFYTAQPIEHVLNPGQVTWIREDKTKRTSYPVLHGTFSTQFNATNTNNQ